MQQQPRADVWANAASYEPYVGRWSRLVAREFLAWLALPDGQRWLDVGCGTGALSQTILARARPRRLYGVDPSWGFVSYTSAQLASAPASFAVGDARWLPLRSGICAAAVAGLVLNFVPDAMAAVREMARVVQAGATVAAYVWDYAGQMQLIRAFWDAAVALDPAALELDEGRRFPLCQPEPLGQLFESVGLEHVAVRAIDIQTTFRDFDEYWVPFLGGQGPAPGYAVALSEERRAELRERLRASLPASADGSIQLIARAWAVRGQAPA